MKYNLLLAVSYLSLSGSVLLGVDNDHLNAGAAGVNPGDHLVFANGDLFAVNSGFVQELTYASSGPYQGNYAGNITFTALPTTIDNGGPVPNAPAPGSFVMAGIVSVQGPAGGSFSFWDDDASAPTLTYGVGYDVPSPTSLWALSDASLGAGNPGADPFGHLHGRSFSATESGEYTVGFKLFDTSINGAGGGPIHTPSDVLQIRFAAIPEPSEAALVIVGGLALACARLRTGLIHKLKGALHEK